MKQSIFNQKIDLIRSYLKLLQKNVFSLSDITKIRTDKGAEWGLPKSLTPSIFLKLLLEHTGLSETSIKFPKHTYQLFSLGDVSIWSYCLALAKNSYFTHQTALYMHNLVNYPAERIFVNFEQSRNSTFNGSLLTQEKIDYAFAKPQRVSKNIAVFKNYSIYLVNGQNTNMCGVTEIYFNQNKVRVTNLERTLIDIVVRPSYTKGIEEIIVSYRAARKTVSVKNLVKILQKLSLVYPYHQAIGFLLERTGDYTQYEINQLKDFGLKFDFYLDREIADKEYSKEWKLYYPKSLFQT